MPEYGEFCVSTRPQMALCLVVEDHMTSDGCVSMVELGEYREYWREWRVLSVEYLE